MRDFFDSILSFIAATSLTDIEFGTCEATMPIYTQETYDDLARVLKTRENVSTYLTRLKKYYEAKGVSIEGINQASSNIFIGSPL